MATAVALAPALAHAHLDDVGDEPPTTLSALAHLPWQFEPWVIATLATTAGLYAAGVRRLWHSVGPRRGIDAKAVACFVAGWLALVVALVSPVDAAGEVLFSLHMVQHELLMIVAAPLLVLGRPAAAWAWAVAPWPWAIALARAATRAWCAASGPLTAAVVHALALWAWHLPRFFDAALADPTLHTLQHASFLASALLYWSSVLPAGPRHASVLAAVGSLFGTMLHSGALGALLVVAQAPWYSGYAATASALGIDPLDDQVLGGLIMWIPGGTVYLIAGLALMQRLLAGPEGVATPVAPGPR